MPRKMARSNPRPARGLARGVGSLASGLPCNPKKSLPFTSIRGLCGDPETGSIATACLARSSSPLSPTTQSPSNGNFRLLAKGELAGLRAGAWSLRGPADPSAMSTTAWFLPLAPATRCYLSKPLPPPCHPTKVQRTVTIADLAAIASCGYPDVMSDDKVRAAQARARQRPISFMRKPNAKGSLQYARDRRLLPGLDRRPDARRPDC